MQIMNMLRYENPRGSMWFHTCTIICNNLARAQMPRVLLHKLGIHPVCPLSKLNTQSRPDFSKFTSLLHSRVPAHAAASSHTPKHFTCRISVAAYIGVGRTDGHEKEREKRSEWASQTEWRARMPRCLAENMGRRLCSKCHGVEQILKGPEGGRLFPVWHRMSMILPYFCMLPNPLRIALPPKAVSSFSSLSSSLASLADCRHKTTTVPTWALERGGAAGGRESGG